MQHRVKKINNTVNAINEGVVHEVVIVEYFVCTNLKEAITKNLHTTFLH